MGSTFKTISWQVDQLVNAIETGTVQLPDLQRPFVWPRVKVRDLFDSMYRGYPVGILMFWDDPAVGETRAISKSTDREATHQIVDGQQRLTSLYASIKGKTVRDSDYADRSITISFNPFTERFEVRTPAIEKSPQWIGDISSVFLSPIDARYMFIDRLRETGEVIDSSAERRLEEVISRLHGIAQYRFDVVHIQRDVDKRTVADIFVRINSEGVSLKAYDYILTWLSVFWPEGRERLEDFARDARMTADRASEVSGKRVTWTPRNHYLNVDAGQLIRVLVAVGQNRAKLSDAYNSLQARDRVTGRVDAEKQERELNLLKGSIDMVLRPNNWDEFLNCLPVAGFRSRKQITSATNLVSSYAIWLLGRERYGVDLAALRTLIARWILMSQITYRYTGSGESQLQKDLDAFGRLSTGDSNGFAQILEDILVTELTPDFWSVRVPQLLITSGASLSPQYQAYLAALNVLKADMFMLEMGVAEWMDPTLTLAKGVEGHHLFPRAYQERELGSTDIKMINQAANFAPTDWSTNNFISDDAPSVYWPKLVAERGRNSTWLANQQYWHALPDGWEHMPYEDFLAARRRLMAGVIRDAYQKLSQGTSTYIVSGRGLSSSSASSEEWDLQRLVEENILGVGDNLDPADPDWQVDAVVTENATLMLDGVHEFDSLNEAAAFLGVTNVAGTEFWNLESGSELTPIAQLIKEKAGS